MSRTDKTNPLWVRLTQDPELRVESHDHSNGECDFRDGFVHKRIYPSYDRCGYVVARPALLFVWSRYNKWEVAIRAEANGKARNDLRMDMLELKKMSREDVEDSDFQSYYHRHQAIWESW